MRINKVIIFAISIIVLFVLNLDAAMAGNESCRGFGDGKSEDHCDPGDGKSSTPTIGRLLIEGGGYFLQSIGDIHLFFSRVENSEVSGPDFKALQDAVNAAINNMEKAQAAYLQLKNLAAITPYNQAVINQLIEFDYTGFQKEKGLIPYIFEKVKKYLVCGDIRGIYNEFYDNTGKILETLYAIKKDVDSGISPNISTLCRINQGCSEDKLFGQYVAEVFYSIK